jgi:hemerythrin
MAAISEGTMMSFFMWTNKLSVGVAAFDEEHKIFIRIIDDLYEKLFCDADKLPLIGIVDELIDYMNLHFRSEEQLFEIAQYPQLARHKAQHDELKQKVLKYRKDIGDENGTILAAELLHFLKDWLANHVLKYDKEAGVFLNAKGVH